MTWVLVWAVLVLGAAAVLFLLGRGLWRRTRTVTSQLGVMADRLAAVTDRTERAESPRDAVATTPYGVRSPGPRRRP